MKLVSLIVGQKSIFRMLELKNALNKYIFTIGNHNELDGTDMTVLHHVQPQNGDPTVATAVTAYLFCHVTRKQVNVIAIPFKRTYLFNLTYDIAWRRGIIFSKHVHQKI